MPLLSALAEEQFIKIRVFFHKLNALKQDNFVCFYITLCGEEIWQRTLSNELLSSVRSWSQMYSFLPSEDQRYYSEYKGGIDFHRAKRRTYLDGCYKFEFHFVQMLLWQGDAPKQDTSSNI